MSFLEGKALAARSDKNIDRERSLISEKVGIEDCIHALDKASDEVFALQKSLSELINKAEES
jgi:hypothetical protein